VKVAHSEGARSGRIVVMKTALRRRGTIVSHRRPNSGVIVADRDRVSGKCRMRNDITEHKQSDGFRDRARADYADYRAEDKPVDLTEQSGT